MGLRQQILIALESDKTKTSYTLWTGFNNSSSSMTRLFKFLIQKLIYSSKKKAKKGDKNKKRKKCRNRIITTTEKEITTTPK